MRQIAHHATCEYEFSQEENEVLIAMDAWKRKTGKKFPTITETLSVLKGLGYYRRQAASVSFDEALSL